MRIRHKLLLFLSRNYCKQWRTQIIRGYFKKLNFHGVISRAGLFTIARTMAHILPNIDKRQMEYFNTSFIAQFRN